MYTKRIKVSDHFYLDEIFNKNICDTYGIEALNLIHPNYLKAIDFFRDKINAPSFINNWFEGGVFDDSGFREISCKEGAKLSSHKPIYKFNGKIYGMAYDMKSTGLNGAALYKIFAANAKEFYNLGIRRIESPTVTTGWCHNDFKEHGMKNTIQVIYGTHNIII